MKRTAPRFLAPRLGSVAYYGFSVLCLSGGFSPALQLDGAGHLSPLLSVINAENGADLLPWGGLANKLFKAFTVKCSSETVSRLREDIPLLPEPQPLCSYPSLTLQGKPLLSIKCTLQEPAVWGLIPRATSSPSREILFSSPENSEPFQRGQLAAQWLPLPQRPLCISSQGER